MKKNQNIRDLIYVSGNEIDNKCFYSYGIEFYEFMSCVDKRPENLILLKHNFDNAMWNQHSRFDYVSSLEINDLIEDYVYGYGDFCWVDFNTKEDLDQLSKQQIAELLFFGHLAKPLNEIPKVRFAYYAHDDGWFNKLYVTKLEDYEIIISKTLVLKLMKLTRRSFINIPNNISRVLLESTKEGLFIDLSKIKKSKTGIMIPINVVGHFRDMDKVYDLKEEIIDYKTWLVYSKKSWKLIQEE
ncbi:hypothetical protein [Paenibacillus terrigena]|uniref:hypothetical protein n=1 Tax=Paenibacillus terrigena TaxID=369333 RepID=UPI0028D155FF|nr:hypothetical protein [Paenibacillus terrigena]